MLRPGMMLCDRYEILDVVGAGGMSIVYKAKCHRLNRLVAIKVLKPEFSNDKNFVTKFKIEAQAAAGLSHPNIVNVYDVYDDDGIYFIVMELVDGITLKEYINQNGRLSMDKAIDFSIQIASGLAAAHESHIVHRDIKPQNIIVSKNGTLKVTDFGIARAASPNTLTSGAVGSVHYISPEQARGGYSDERSDIYALGITMYEMVTGRVPFDGDNNVSIALMHIQNDMVSPRQYYPDIYSSFEKIILKATQKKPERRYLTATALIADLRRVQNNPNIDIVVAASAVSNSPTHEWTKEDVKAIREGSAMKDLSADEMNNGYNNQQIQNPRVTSQGGVLTIPVNNERINQLLEDDDPWDEEDDEPEYDNRPRRGGIKKVQDYDDDYDDYDDRYDEEDGDGELDPKLKKSIMIAGIASAVVIIIVIIILVGSVAGWFKFDSKKSDTSTTETTEVAEVTMIDVTGLSQEAALESLKNIGLTNVQVVVEENSDTQEGYVFEQSVKKDTMIKADAEVTLKVAGAAEQVTVPDVTKYTDDQAVTVLQEAGFEPTHSYEYSEDVDKDLVIRTEPNANTTATKGSKVVIVISNGSEVKEVEVPKITGMTEAQAINSLNTAKLSTGNATHQYDDNVKQGYVISQSVADGSKVKEGTTVDYVISDGPEPKQTSYTANISGRITAPADGSYDGQAVTVQVTYNGSVVYEGSINSLTAGTAYDVSATQPGLSDQTGKGDIVIIDANGNNVTTAFSPSVNTSFSEVTE